MKSLLKSVGENAYQIRHIQLEFCEVSAWTYDMHLLLPGKLMYNKPILDVLRDALECLADFQILRSRLKTLEIKHLDVSSCSTTNHAAQQATFEMFFSRHSVLADALRRMKRVELICEEVEAWGDEGHEYCVACCQAKGLMAMKADMA